MQVAHTYVVAPFVQSKSDNNNNNISFRLEFISFIIIIVITSIHQRIIYSYVYNNIIFMVAYMQTQYKRKTKQA